MTQGLKLEVFNFDDPQCWSRVQKVAEHPLVQRALTAGMNALCSRELGHEWTPEIGPWEFSKRNNTNWSILEALSPRPDSPNWYRIFGHCNTIAVWCAAVGSLLYPDHEWYYAHNSKVPKFGLHSAGIGLKEGKMQSLVVMDILFSPQVLREGTELWLARMLTGPDSQQITLQEAIERFETGRHT